MEDLGTESADDASPEAEKPNSDQVTPNGHLTSTEQLTNGKSDEEEAERPLDTMDVVENGIDASVKPRLASLPPDVSQQPLATVEKDGTDSPATAEREMNSPVVEGKSKSVSASPQKIRREEPATLTASENIKLEKEIVRLKEVLDEISPQAAQRVLREKWRTFLFEGYNEDHIAFVLRAGLKNSNATILERVLRDDGTFRDTLLKAAARKPAYTQKVLRNVSADVVRSYVSEKIIDQVIAERFKTVPGRTLIKWLAEAERLGYRADDILDDEDESVIPNITSRDNSPEYLAVEAPPPFKAPAPASASALAPRYEPRPQLELPIPTRTFC